MKRAFLAALVATTACGGSPPPLPPPPPAPAPVAWAPPAETQVAPTTPDAPFRERAPEPGVPGAFVPPKIQTIALKNGLRVLLVERHDLPIVNVRVVLKSGAADLGGDRPEVMTFLGAMLEQGSKKRSALELSDAWEAIGAAHGAFVSNDSGGAYVKVLSQELDRALDLLSEVVLSPSFPEAEVERVKSRWISSAQQQKSSPGALAQAALAASIFGPQHPYGRPPILKDEQIRRITRADVVRAYGRAFTAGNAVLCVAGDVTKDALVGKLEAAFGKWKGPAPARAKIAPPPAPKDGARVVLVDRPGAPQAQVLLAEVGVPFGTPDRDALVVMNTILGGMFSSRINLNLREKHAYTYGARSSFEMLHGAGPFTAGGAIVADKTAGAVHELLTELGAIRERDVTEDELALAKESIKRRMPARFETVSAVTEALADLVVYDLPLDEYEKRLARIDAVTAADVKRVAAAHLHSQKVKIIVVGDRKSLGAALETLHMGSAEVRDAYGDLVK